MIQINGRSVSFLKYYIFKISEKCFEKFFSKNLFFIEGRKFFFEYYFSKVILHKLYLFFIKLEKKCQKFRKYIIFISTLKKLLIKVYLNFNYFKTKIKRKKTFKCTKNLFEIIFPTFNFKGSLVRKCTPFFQKSLNIYNENFQNSRMTIKILDFIFCFNCKYLHKNKQENNFFYNFFFFQNQFSNCKFFMNTLVSSFHICPNCLKKSKSFQKTVIVMKLNFFDKEFYFCKNKNNVLVLTDFLKINFILENKLRKKFKKTFKMDSKINLFYLKTQFILHSKLNNFSSCLFFKKFISKILVYFEKPKTKINPMIQGNDLDFNLEKIILSSKIFKVKLKYSIFFLKNGIGIEKLKNF
jgi:hypothetical protein